MIRYRRTLAAAAVALAGFAVGLGPVTAQAQTNDERFEAAVSSLGIKAAPGTDIPALGRGVCDTLTREMSTNPNPVPAVRGVVSWLQSANMSRDQAVGFLRASSAIYCPQYVRFTGR